MIIICPSCMARYRLAGGSAAIPAEGRRLRCSRCGERWQASPVNPPPELLPALLDAGPTTAHDRPASTVAGSRRAAELVVDSEDEAEESTEVGIGEASAAERARRAARRMTAPRAAAAGRARRRSQAFLLGMLLALLAAGLHYRTDVVGAVPSSAGIYELIGLPVNLRGLEFRDVTTRRISEDGHPVLIVEAEIANLRPIAADVPAVRIAVRGSQGEELYVWTVEPRQRSIEAGEAMQLRSRLALPPSGAWEVQLRFAARTATSLGLR